MPPSGLPITSGYDVIAMVHEEKDAEYAVRLRGAFGDSVAIHQTHDAVAAKALVGGASLVVSSRFHGLVNALSQGVPAVGTGWSHKYAQLFNDYGCPDALWDVDDPEATSARMETWLSGSELEDRRRALAEPAAVLKDGSRDMWAEVRGLLSA